MQYSVSLETKKKKYVFVLAPTTTPAGENYAAAFA